MAKSTSGSAGAEEDTYTVKYYQLVKKTENSYELTELTCTQQTKLGDYDGAFLHTGNRENYG